VPRSTSLTCQPLPVMYLSYLSVINLAPSTHTLELEGPEQTFHLSALPVPLLIRRWCLHSVTGLICGYIFRMDIVKVLTQVKECTGGHGGSAGRSKRAAQCGMKLCNPKICQYLGLHTGLKPIQPFQRVKPRLFLLSRT